jgi:hypothetical protein
MTGGEMLRCRQLFGLIAFVCLLLFGFQNCGMQFEDDLASTSDNFDTSGLSYNPDGTFTFPLPGQSGKNGSSSGGSGSGDINLGSGGSGSGGSGSGGSGGFGGSDPYDPYNDNHSKASLYPALPGVGGVMGNKLYYFNNNGVLNLGGHMTGAMLWQSYYEGIVSWTAQQSDTRERSSLLVMSFKKLSQEGTNTTYFLDGTSICYHFSANAKMPTASTLYSWTERYGGHDGSESYYSINGYQVILSGKTIVKKTEEEMTMLESAFCGAGGAYDQAAINAFFSVLQQYPILTPSGSSFSLKNTGRF